eukprot:TRINITY_DN21736_c0_g1_i1.p1 TRINITY_DN21736_c0_g1~~TRINITY_DN21736_c0_g1_i1.p1  ORF type:complete len:426 (+),score=110.33 TRINITY_DN21736_c0_g1_i1:68-1279(+)
MDGLDELMAQVEAEEKAKAATPKADCTPPSGKVRTPQASAGKASTTPSASRLSPRRAAVVERLQRLRLDLADPAVRDTLEAVLSPSRADSSQVQEMFQYYLSRPELSQYTLETELPRMSYTVVPRQGSASAVSSTAEIQALYAEDAKLRERGEDRGPEVLWRMANQSVFAGALEAVHKHVVVPHDDGGALCLSATTEGAEFRVDLEQSSLCAKCDLSLGTIASSGGRLRLASVSLVVDASVSRDGQRCLKLSQAVGELRPEVVFDEQLVDAAALLADFTEGSPPVECTSKNEPSFAGVRAATALGEATASAFGAAANVSASAFGAAAWGLRRALSSGGSAEAPAETTSGEFAQLFDRMAGAPAGQGYQAAAAPAAMAQKLPAPKPAADDDFDDLFASFADSKS